MANSVYIETSIISYLTSRASRSLIGAARQQLTQAWWDVRLTKAAEDALHIAIATVHGMDFLLTWNCKHIANPEIQKRIALYLEEQGLFLPFICTPDELLGDENE
jgi:hypothetical protein